MIQCWVRKRDLIQGKKNTSVLRSYETGLIEEAELLPDTLGMRKIVVCFVYRCKGECFFIPEMN